MYKKYARRSKISKGEKRISELLDKFNINYIREKTFDDCLSLKNNRLRFDFFLPDRNLLIEYQGHHHYNPINKYRRAKKVHELTVLHDNIKREYVKNKNLELHEIPYKEYNNLENILINILGVSDDIS